MPKREWRIPREVKRNLERMCKAVGANGLDVKGVEIEISPVRLRIIMRTGRPDEDGAGDLDREPNRELAEFMARHDMKAQRPGADTPDRHLPPRTDESSAK